MKTILYARSACPDQEAIRKQLEKMERYAADMGYTDLERIIDDGIAGTGINDLDERPGLVQMMEMVEKEEVANVIVTDFSRLSRNMRVTSDILEMLDDYDVRLVALEDIYDSMSEKYRPNQPFAVSMINICKEMQSRKWNQMEFKKWGRMHESQLSEKRPALYASLRESARLNDYLEIISDTADHRLRELLHDMRAQVGLPESPHPDNLVDWTRCMDELYKKAAQIVRSEIIEI